MPEAGDGRHDESFRRYAEVSPGRAPFRFGWRLKPCQIDPIAQPIELAAMSEPSLGVSELRTAHESGDVGETQHPPLPPACETAFQRSNSLEMVKSMYGMKPARYPGVCSGYQGGQGDLDRVGVDHRRVQFPKELLEAPYDAGILPGRQGPGQVLVQPAIGSLGSWNRLVLARHHRDLPAVIHEST
jgi:hypothetical protein